MSNDSTVTNNGLNETISKLKERINSMELQREDLKFSQKSNDLDSFNKIAIETKATFSDETLLQPNSQG